MPSLQASARAPGPPGHWLLGHIPEFRRDVLGLLLDSTRRYGDLVRFRLGPHLIHLVNHPDHASHVLQRRAANYDKHTRSTRSIRAVCGESLLTSNGAAWQAQRRVLQPFFHAQSVRRFAGFMVDRTQAMLAAWRAHARTAQPLDVASEMMRLTYAIAAGAFFEAGTSAEALAIEESMQVILPHTFERLERLVNWPAWLPTPAHRRFQAARRALDQIVYALVRRHREQAARGQVGADLLAMLLQARTEPTGAPLSDQAIRDQTITFLLAGHETTSNALTWTLYLLARHPHVQSDLQSTLRSVLGGRAPTLDDLPALEPLRRVIREALRLYPPIWIIERRVIAEDSIAGVRLPAGSGVVVCPFTLHRHPGFWTQPDEFQPARFETNPPAAYLPFGAGPRHCIGSEFALLEAQLILALVLQNFALTLAPGAPIEPWPGITLRTRSGLPLTLTDLETMKPNS